MVVLLPNGRTQLLAMPAVRQALAQIVDRERERWLRGSQGAGVAQQLPVLDSAAVSDGADSGSRASVAATAPGASSMGRFLSTIGQAVSIGSPESLLDAAGLLPAPSPSPAPPSGRVRLYQGRPVRLRLLVPSGSSELAELARRLSDATAKVGLKIDIETTHMPDFLLRLRRGAFELVPVRLGLDRRAGAIDIEPLLAALARWSLSPDGAATPSPSPANTSSGDPSQAMTHDLRAFGRARRRSSCSIAPPSRPA